MSELPEQPATQPQTAPTSDGATPQADGQPPSEMTLPREAIEFAGKCFDLARKGSDHLLGPYLDAGLPPNLMNDKGNTLLMLAAYNGRASTVRLLHQKGADLDRCNDNGQSPLAGAIFKNETETVKTLLELGADPRKGTPSAMETARIFKQEQWLEQMNATEEEKSAPLPTFGFMQK